MNEQETKKLKEYVEGILKENSDLFDLKAEQDLTLSLEENKTIINEKLRLFNKTIGQMLINREMKNIQDKYNALEHSEENRNQDELLTYENLNKVRTIAIYGDIGTGKTALAYKIIELFKGKKDIYFLKHPNKNILKPLGYKNLRSLEDLEYINNAVVYWDEPQLKTAIYDNKTNFIISKVCSLARQRNITLIISSSDTRVFTKHNESFFELWLIKDLCFSMIKNGSRIKHIIRENSFVEPEGFKADKNEFISYSKILGDFDGRHRFTLINNWTDELSRPYDIIKY